MATDKNSTHEWFVANSLGFMYEHLKSFTLDDLAFLHDREIEELIQETQDLSEFSKVDKTRFKHAVRRLRFHKNQSNSNNNDNYNNNNKTKIEDMKLDLQSLTQENQRIKAKHVQNNCHYTIKLVLLGYGAGKTSIIHQFVHGKFLTDFNSTIGDLFSTVIWLANEKRVFLKISDTGSSQNFDWLNMMAIRDADWIVTVYDISDKNSFNKIETKYIPMIKEYCCKDNVYVMIVGNQQDLRWKKNQNTNIHNVTDLIPTEVGQALADKYSKEEKDKYDVRGGVRLGW